jgi:putative two-component system response regulator
MPVDVPEPGRPRVPPSAVAISTAAFGVPMVAALGAPDALGEYGALLWLLALIPAFLLAYHRGWRGAATALALGMASLSVTQVVATAMDLELPDLLLGVVVAYIGITPGIGGMAEKMHRDKDTVEQMAYTDELTRLPNRRHITLFLENEYEAAVRGRVLSTVLFDLEHFKEYNDRHGHATGDEALRVFADVLARTTRRSNLSGRLGGEEFLTVLADTGAEGAMIFAERVRTVLKGHHLADPPLTVSAGIATFHPGMRSADQFLAAADHALYQAKHAGRDQVKMFGRALAETSPPSTRPPPEGEPQSEYPREPEDLGKTRPSDALLPNEITEFGRGRSVLVVEHEDPARERTLEYLQREGFTVYGATDAPSAIEKLAIEYDVVVVSYPLPSATVHDLVATVKSRWPATQVVVMTTVDSAPEVVAAMRAGADQLLNKPIEMSDLRAKIGNALRRRDRVASGRLEARMLSVDSDERSAVTWARIREGLLGLVEAAELHDPYTQGHGERTAKFAVSLAKHAGLDETEITALEDRALLHGLGKLSIPSEVLGKDGRLDSADWITVRNHPKSGRSIVEAIVTHDMTLAAITWHSELWDGTGYPDKLSGEGIPIAARLTALANALSAMVSGRAYRRAYAWEDAVAEIQKDFGTAFDPELEPVFEKALEQLHSIYLETAPAEG